MKKPKEYSIAETMSELHCGYRVLQRLFVLTGITPRKADYYQKLLITGEQLEKLKKMLNNIKNH